MQTWAIGVLLCAVATTAPSDELACCDNHAWAGSNWRGSTGEQYCTDEKFHAICVTDSSCGLWEDCQSNYCSDFSGTSPCPSWASGVCGACKACFNEGCPYFKTQLTPQQPLHPPPYLPPPVIPPPSPPPPPASPAECCDGHSQAWVRDYWHTTAGATYCTDAGFHANCVNAGSSCGAWEDCRSDYCSSFSGSEAPCASWASGMCSVCRMCFNEGCAYYDSWVSPPAAPPTPAATLTVDPFVQLAVGGIRQLERAKWFNIHADPAESSWTEAEIATLGGDYRAHLGRAFHFSSRMMPWSGVVEDPNRPGYADRASLIESCETFPNSNGAWPIESVDFVTSAKPEKLFKNGCERETHPSHAFVPGSPDATAEFYSDFVAHCMKPAMSTRALLEVVNECDVKYKTDWRTGCNVTWQGFIELHKAVGQRLHADYAAGAYGVQPLVCGPTTAWPEFQATDFEMFNDIFGPFIAEAGNDLDCISTHLYDVYGGMDHIDETGVSWRTGSNLDAVLDLMEAYAHATIGKVVPHLSSAALGVLTDALAYAHVTDVPAH